MEEERNCLRSKPSLRSTWTMCPWCTCSFAPFDAAPNPLCKSAMWKICNASTRCRRKVLKWHRAFYRKTICSLGKLWSFESCRKIHFDTALNVVPESLYHFENNFSAVPDIKSFIYSRTSAKWLEKDSEFQFPVCTSSPTKRQSKPTKATCPHFCVSYSLFYSCHSCQMRSIQFFASIRLTEFTWLFNVWLCNKKVSAVGALIQIPTRVHRRSG